MTMGPWACSFIWAGVHNVHKLLDFKIFYRKFGMDLFCNIVIHSGYYYDPCPLVGQINVHSYYVHIKRGFFYFGNGSTASHKFAWHHCNDCNHVHYFVIFKRIAGLIIGPSTFSTSGKNSQVTALVWYTKNSLGNYHDYREQVNSNKNCDFFKRTIVHKNYQHPRNR